MELIDEVVATIPSKPLVADIVYSLLLITLVAIIVALCEYNNDNIVLTIINHIGYCLRSEQKPT